MRKYSIPKIMYVLLILMIASLSIGSTYAYFSAIATANGTLSMGKIEIEWVDNNKNATIKYLFDDNTTEDTNEALSISISGRLKRGDYTQILSKDSEGNDVPIKLEISNANGLVSAYCRMKITATYKQIDGTVTPCSNEWLQLALADEDDPNNKTFITNLDNGWVFNEYDKYYYYGIVSNDVYILRELEAGAGQLVADYLYLSSDVPSSLLGSEMHIILTLEAVQTANNAYKTLWNLS